MDIRTLVLTIAIVAIVFTIRTVVSRVVRSAYAEPPFIGDDTNDKLVVVNGWRTGELSKILADFTESYEDRLPVRFRFALPIRNPQ